MPAHPKIRDSALLKKVYVDQEMSTTDISKKSHAIFGVFVTPATVYNCLVRYQIPVRDKATSVSMAKSKVVKLATVAKTTADKFNARWLISTGAIHTLPGSKLEKKQATKLAKLLKKAGDASLVPESLVEESFKQARQRGFPYYKFDDEGRLAAWRTLTSFVPSASPHLWDGHGSGLASSFHPHFFECRKKGKMSPVEFFNSDSDLKRGIKKILCLYGNASEPRLREICRSEDAVSHINNFPPRVAATVVKGLYPEGAQIAVLDPCAGFGGRMIGCAASGRVQQYYGIDLSPKTIAGLRNTAKFLGGTGCGTQFELVNSNCIDEMSKIESRFDLVFTSPPFLDMEEYVGVKYETDYSKWLCEFVVPFVAGCWRCLKPGGKLAIYSENISKDKRFSDDLSKAALERDFVTSQPVMFAKSRGLYQRIKGMTKLTPVYVWGKP